MKTICLYVDPGICGCTCRIEARCSDKRTAHTEIAGSDCSMIQQLAEMIRTVTFQDVFVPLTENKIFVGAEKAGCHLACPVPSALVKAAEAVLTLALPRDVSFTFQEE